MEKLTKEQIWGLQYATQLHNALLTEGDPLLTTEQWIDKTIEEIANHHYTKLIAYKEQEALAMFRSLAPEQQDALIMQFKIPDVIKE